MTLPTAITGAIEAPQHYRIGLMAEANTFRAAKLNRDRHAAEGQTSLAEKAEARMQASKLKLREKVSDASSIPVDVLIEVFSA